MSRATVNSHLAAELADRKGEPGSTFKIVAAYLACTLIWGTTWYGIRVCIGEGGYPAYQGAALRFTLAAGILVLIWLFRRGRFKTISLASLAPVGLAGLLGGVSYGIVYGAEQFLSGGLTAVVCAIGPLVTALMAAATGTEKLSKVTAAGSICALGGIAIVFHDRLHVSPEQASTIAALTAAVCLNAVSNLMMKRCAHIVPPVPTNTIFLFAAACSLWIFSAAAGQMRFSVPPAVGATAALAYLTIFGTLASFACFFYLLRHVRLTTAVTLAFVTPVVAVIMDHLFEKKVFFTTESYLGMALVIVSVAATVLSNARLNFSQLETAGESHQTATAGEQSPESAGLQDRRSS